MVIDSVASRSLRLLERWLSPRQLEQWRGSDYFGYSFFTVVGGATGYEYELWNKVGGYNIIDVTNARWICIQPQHDDAFPIEDVLLSQKLALEHNEQAILSRANTYLCVEPYFGRRPILYNPIPGCNFEEHPEE